MARGHMVCWKCDAGCNPIDNQNSILDRCLNEVKFPDEEMTELAANIIADSIYASCDVNGYEYLLLEAFINYKKNGSALSVRDQKIVVKGLQSQQLAGTFVANGKMDPHCERSYPILKSCIQSRLLNMPWPKAYNLNQHLTGGFITS